MYKEARRLTWVEINLANLDNNIREIRRRVGENASLIGVVKADAYGHGAVRCSEVLARNGVESFAVATIPEALELREAGICGRIIILGICPKTEVDILVEKNLTPVISTHGFAAALSDEAVSEGKRADCLLALDTGMGRIGFPVYTEEMANAAVCDAERIASLEGLNLVGMFSHFADSDGQLKDYTIMQLERYNGICGKLSAAGINLPFSNIANSAAIIEYPEATFDSVRPGIIMYGCSPSENVSSDVLNLKPVMSVKAKMVLIKTIPAGSNVSYGCRWTAERESRIATLSLGYADGYPRALTNNVDVLIRGKRAPVVGTICMDQCMVDVTDIPGVCYDDVVTVVGRDGDEEITLEEIAARAGTISNEIMCGLTLRLARVYVE